MEIFDYLMSASDTESSGISDVVKSNFKMKVKVSDLTKPEVKAFIEYHKTLGYELVVIDEDGIPCDYADPNSDQYDPLRIIKNTLNK